LLTFQNAFGVQYLDKGTQVSYHPKERYALFSGGFTEIGFILFIAFLIFGPKKLPEIARILGKGMGELRRASNELKFSLEEEIRNLDRKDEVSYPEESTYPYLESKVESSEPVEPEVEEAHELESQPESDLEPTPKYGYNHTEPSHEEPEPRP
jgi:sec-independent protein translocase protein TatB